MVLRIAEEMFLRDGYGDVTVRTIADASGISAHTIYKTYGGKAGLVAAIQELALQGAGPVPAPERSDAMSQRERNADAILRNWATLATEVAPRGSPITLLVRSAAVTDPQMAALWQRICDAKRDRMRRNAERLIATGQVCAEVTVEQVRDILYTYSAPELYEILVLQAGWSLEQYGDFVYRGTRSQLIDASP
jgi:AcrR family transcriptional regulator